MIQLVPLDRFKVDMIFEGLKGVCGVGGSSSDTFLVIQGQQLLNYILGVLFHAKGKIGLTLRYFLENFVFELAVKGGQTYTHLVNYAPQSP